MSETKVIKVVVTGTTDGDVRTVEMSNSLHAFQEVVGGYIETTTLAELRAKNIVLVVNEEGLLQQLDGNENLFPFFFVGNVLFTTYNAEGDFVSLTDEQEQFVYEWLRGLE